MPKQVFAIEAADIRCTLCSAGASILSVQVRNRRGGFTDVALSPQSLPGGESDPSLAGRTIGPCCGRVRDGAAVIDGRQIRLTRNENRNHLHGGLQGCASLFWTVLEHTPSGVLFRLDLPDGLDGYPGNRTLYAEYAVSGSALRAVYSAATDAPTWLDMTSHVYWDLSGNFDGSAMDQILQIAASSAVYNDAAHLPVSIAPADGALDFRAPCVLSRKLADHAEHPQLNIARGFNNAYRLDPRLQEALGFSARLRSPHSGLCLTLQTDQPAIVLYTGGFLNEQTALRTPPGFASPGCAVALEAQGLPDPFHLPGIAPEILRPGEAWRRETVWRFDA